VLGLPQTRHPFRWCVADEIAIREDLSHETSAEWNRDRGRLSYRCTCLGADQRQPNDAITQRTISDVSADGIDGLAYAEPSGEGATSRSATREGERPLQR